MMTGWLAFRLSYLSVKVFYFSFTFLIFSIPLSKLSYNYDLNVEAMAIIFFGLLSITLGILISHAIIPKSIVDFAEDKAEILGGSRWRFLVITFSLLCLTLFYILFMRNGTIPIAAMLIDKVPPQELKEIRAASYKTNSAFITFPMSILRSSVATVIVAVATHHIVHGKSLITSYLAILIALVYSTYSTAIFPTAYLILIITLYFIFQFTLNARFITTSLFIVFITLNTPVLFDYLAQSGHYDSISYSTLFIKSMTRHVSRFIFEQAKLIEAYTIFVDNYGFGGGVYHTPSSIFIGKKLDIANLVFLFNNPDGYYLGKASVPFMGGAYADGGFFAVIFAGITIGTLLVFGELVIRRYTLGALRYPFIIAYSGQGWIMPSALFGTGIISKGWLPTILICILFSRILAKGKVN